MKMTARRESEGRYEPVPGSGRKEAAASNS